MSITDELTPTKLQAWILASRPKTLPAAITPVLIGSALALNDGVFNFGPALAALLCALFIQIGTNFSNDLLDYKAGTDTEERTGPARAVASKWLTENEMLWGTIIIFGLTVPLGLYLIAKAGIIVLFIGLLSIAAGIAYTGGPFPLAYNGLGDLFVLIFFGGVATVGTYFVQAVDVTAEAFIAAIPAGGLITNILVVNNYRDIDSDKNTRKHTLAVILGKAGSRIEYVSFVVLSYLVPLVFFVWFDYSYWIFLPLLSLPLAIQPVRLLYSGVEGRALNKVLAETARLSLIYALLLSIGIIL